MPTSRLGAITAVLRLVTVLQPHTILDVGAGWGKWGMLFREYTDIVAAGSEPDRYRKENWRVKIVGIEGFEPYITPVHEYVYDEMHVGDMRLVVPTLPDFDLIFIGDAIEHLPKEDGVVLLSVCRERAAQAVVVTTPARETFQSTSHANPLEAHLSVWSGRDFEKLGRTVVRKTDDDLIIAVLPSEAVPSSLVVRAVFPPSLRTELRARWHGLKRRVTRVLPGRPRAAGGARKDRGAP